MNKVWGFFCVYMLEHSHIHFCLIHRAEELLTL